jgi:hypothetical protein
MQVRRQLADRLGHGSSRSGVRRAGRAPHSPGVAGTGMYARPMPDPGDLWKRWLMGDLRDLRNEMKGGNWLERESFRSAVVERFVFISAYISRKLFESDQLTIDLIERDWPIEQYRCTRHPPARQQFRVTRDMHRWWQPIADHYDLANAQNKTLRLRDLCNLVIHHFAFEVRSPDADSIEIYFNSDRSKAEFLNMITLDTCIEFADEVAHDRAVFFTVDRKTNRQVRHRRRRLDLL